MSASRNFVVPNPLILSAIGLAAIATAVLLTFPDLLVWQVASWTLAGSILALLVLVLAAAYSLFANRSARTWPRILTLALGALCLLGIGIGSF